MWQEWVGEAPLTYANNSLTGTVERGAAGQDDDAVIGLIDWDRRLAYHNWADGQGQYIPNSASVQLEGIQQSFGTGPLKPYQVGDLTVNLLDAVKGQSTFAQQILDDLSVRLTGVASGSTQWTRLHDEYRDRLAEPWKYYAITLHVTESNKDTLLTKLQQQKSKYQPRAEFEFNSYQDRVAQKFAPDTGYGLVYLQNGAITNDILVERVSATKAHNVAITSYLGNPLPLHSSIGSQDTVVIIEGVAFSDEAKAKILGVKEEFDRRVISKLSRKFILDGNDRLKQAEVAAGFLRIENEICQLMGVDFVMPLTVDFQSVEGQPGLWKYTMSFIEYDPKLLISERMKYMDTTLGQLGTVYQYGWNWKGETNPILLRAQDYFSLQYSLSREEVYPDMSLPSFGEVQYWISKCRELASRYLTLTTAERKKLAATKSLPDKQRRNLKLSPAEASILDSILEFLPEYGTDMKGWTQFLGTKNRLSESGTYANPDFYVYYDPRDTWGFLVDTLSGELMGKRDGLMATGQTPAQAKASPPQGGIRFTDSAHGDLRSVSDKDFFTSNSERIGDHLQLLYTQTFPADRAKTTKDLARKWEAEMDARAGADRWWQGGSVHVSVANADNPNIIVLDPDTKRDLYSGQLGPSVLNFEPQLQNGNLTSGENSDGDALLEFNRLSWRQDWTRKAAGMGAAKSSEYEQLLNEGSDVNRFSLSPDLIANQTLHSVTTIDALNTLTRKNVEYQLGADVGDDDFFPVLDDRGSASSPETSHITFLGKTARANSVYARWKTAQASETPPISLGSNDGQKNFVDSYDYIDWQSSRYANVDPQIIRALLLRRDGLGAYKALLSTGQTGFGDLDEAYLTSRGLDGKNPESVIRALTKDYSQYMAQYGNVPSLALTALNMQINSAARGKWLDDKGQLLPDVDKHLKNVADQLRGNRFSPKAGQLIQDALAVYPEASRQVNEYFTGYIHLSRVSGSTLFRPDAESVADPYFYPLNGLILVDLEDNDGRYLDTDFSPTGGPITIELQRKTVSAVLSNIKRFDPNFDPNTSSLDLQIQLSQRLAAAQDPHSEAAIYGSLVDMRTHSPFGTLAAAFPSYQVLIINEGFYWGGGNKKLWDQYYTRAGVSEIEVHKTRMQAASECHITFSNMFMNLTQYYQMELLQQELAEDNNARVGKFFTQPSVKNFGVFWDAMLRNLPDEVVRIWQNNHLRQIALGAGARLHVRMGYGSNASQLPVVFNGTVAQAPVTDGYVTLMAVGDGYELDKTVTTNLVPAANSYAFSTGGAFGTGKDPSSIITEAMISAGLWDIVTGGNFLDRSNGVAHFGEVYFDGSRYFTPELQLNIYGSSQTQLEQGIPMIRDYLNVAALYNWNNSNLFSVEIHEPTMWKIMEVCRRASLDFVASAEDFALRSSVFFGKWWWPYNYGYAPTILDFLQVGNEPLQGISLDPQAAVTKIDPKELDGSVLAPPEQEQSTVGTQQLPASEKNLVIPSSVNEAIGTAINSRFGQELLKYKVVQVKKSNSVRPNFELYEFVTDINFDPPHANEPEKWVVAVTYDLEFKTDNGGSVNPYDPSKPSSFGTEAENTERFSPSRTVVNDLQFQNMPNQYSLGNNLVNDINVLRQHLTWKTYMQAYFAHSMINLLQNEIVTDGPKVITDAYGTHKYNGVFSSETINKTIQYSVDSDIQPADRKVLAVDTGLVLTAVQGLGKALAEGALTGLSYVPVAGSLLARGALDYVQQTPTTPAVENAVVSALVDGVKDMYGGVLVIQGQPTMKPRDLLFVDDHKLNMHGPVFVKDVIHRFDGQNGLLTFVSPDCVVYPHSSLFGHHLVCSLSVGILKRMTGMYVYKSMSALSFGEAAYWRRLGALTDVHNDLGRYNRTLKASSLSAEEEQKVLRAAKTRIGEQLKKQKLPGDVGSEEYNKALFEQQRKIDLVENAGSLEELDKTARTNLSLAGVTEDDFVRAEIGGTKAQINLQELQILADKELDLEAAKATGIESKAAERAANNRRAAYVQNNRNSFLEGDGEAISTYNKDLEVLNKELAGLHADLEDVTRSIQNLSKFETPEELEATADLLASNKQKEIEITEQIRKVNRRVADKIDLIKIEQREADTVLRFASRGGGLFTQAGGEIEARVAFSTLDDVGHVQNFAQRFFGSVFGGTQDAAEAVGKFAANLGSPTAEQEAIATLTNAERLAMAPRGTTRLRQHLRSLREFYLGAKAMSGAEKGALVLERSTKMAQSAMKMARNLYRGGTLLSYAGPQAIVRIAVDATIMIVGGSIIEGINSRWKARQCVKILPLMIQDHPYVAGIRGHQGAVVGDDPSWADNLLFGWSRMNTDVNKYSQDFAGYSSYIGSNLLLFGAGMMGLEAPSYATDSFENPYIEEERANGIPAGN
jgi:hypothetical protein